MKTLTWISLVGSLAITGATSVVSAAHAEQQDTTRLTVVQAVPGQTLDVDLDGRPISTDSATGAIVGPLDVDAGQHDVTFSDASGEVVVRTSVDLTSGAAQDLVVHLPAQVDGAPLATLYTTPTTPIGVDKARVLIAHTASVAPADVRLDGTVVFTNIANGEFATADVAQGDHVAELLPSGLTSRPILGPLDVSLSPATATMVYAVGNTGSGSMQAITHSIPLTSNGTMPPASIEAGSAGLAAGIHVTPFSSTEAAAPAADAGVAWRPLGGAAMVTLLGMAFVAAGRTRRRITVDSSR
ncbi:protein of unknown function [Nocardioides exalbidus]|uniref:DUF4397 domain-containing protein n=1 Tax=Nocardioides exalbidus TaxID=402596 RepID=A0A1H4Q6Y6_9ACTN|nr:DUF4397 domain-containing protein [Nocardioides exalbidus]SEC15385.1 protein of unknown function [Nocardioides exalbidus]